tara:strand:+ start:317 stop:565 length:249 start_codon:yes stop_codon:yes gene_type:complete
MSKIYIENSRFMEYIDELATRITEEKFGEETYDCQIDDDCIEEVFVFKKENGAQDFYTETYDEYETLANNLLGVYSNNELNK